MNRDLQKDIQFYIIYKNEMLGSCHNVQQEEIGERKCISRKLQIKTTMAEIIVKTQMVEKM